MTAHNQLMDCGPQTTVKCKNKLNRKCNVIICAFQVSLKF